MRIAVRSLKRLLIITGIAAGLLAVAIPALADYLGPDRSVSTWTMERLVCEYQAAYDPPGAGYYGCGLTLYEPARRHLRFERRCLLHLERLRLAGRDQLQHGELRHLEIELGRELQRW